MFNESSQNIAHTKRYKAHFAKEFNRLAIGEPKIEKPIVLGGGEFRVEIESFEAAKKFVIYSDRGEAILRRETIDSHLFFSLIKHRDQNSYIIYNIDLYGHSIFNAQTRENIDYIPAYSFQTGNETFIWTDAQYCPKNNLLVIDGCYWASSRNLLFFDFSEPMKPPYKLYANGYEFDEIYHIPIDSDLRFNRFTENGEVVLTYFNDGDPIERSATIDILRGKQIA